MDRHPLSPGGNTLVILDTCVLLPSRLSDVLFDLMLEGLYFAYWTGDVETEFLRNWPEVHPDASKSGTFLDRLFNAAPARTSQAIAKSLSDLLRPPYSKAELVAALGLHGVKATADGLV